MQKPKSFRPWQPDQTTLLPPSPREWLAEDHQVYFLLDLVDELDLSAIVSPAQAKDPRGEKGFDPRMLTMLLLYAYCVGTVSSRKIERACYEDLAFRVLTGNQQPDHSRISEFRRRNLDALKGLFVQILRLCQIAGLASLGHVALDGTKVKANASKHKAMSHERMLRAEKQLEQEINALMRRAEILDAQEDQRYGKTNRGSDLPEELCRRQDRLARIRQARKEMEAETAAAAARQRLQEADQASAKAADAAAHDSEASPEEQAELNQKAESAAAKAREAKDKATAAAEEAGLESPDLEPLAAGAMPRRGLARKADGTPKGKTQRNFTDPDVSAGLQLPAGGRQRASGDRGGGHQQPAAGCRAPGAHAPAHRHHCRCSAQGDDDGCGVLERGQRQGLPRSGHRRLHRHRPAAAWAATASETGASTQRCRCQNPYGTQAEKQAGISDLCPAQSDRGAGERTDQRGQGAAPLPVEGPGEGRW
jgi:transposase